MLNFTLATVIFIAVTSRSSSSQVFRSKYVLRLALAHSKYTGNSEIVVIRIRQRMKFPLLTFSTKS